MRRSKVTFEPFEELRERFDEEGKRAAVCSAARATECLASIRGLRDEGKLGAAIYDAYFPGMSAVHKLANGASIIVVASPDANSIMILDLPDGPFQAVIPATYLADRVAASNEAILKGVLGSRGYSFERAVLPVKTLAARTGLGAYGRDNILYVKGMGSFARLNAYWTDAALGESGWGESGVMTACASCSVCAAVCPTDCIHEGDFLVDATRCLTFLNEGEGAFPSWLDPSAHNAAIGCLKCQEACPENAAYRSAVSRRFAFDREASLGLLEGRSAGSSAPEAARLLALLGMVGEECKLARNLAALGARGR
jgi:epoxyqueuosine reductase